MKSIAEINTLEYYWNNYKKVFLQTVPEDKLEPFKIAFMFGSAGALEIAQNMSRHETRKGAVAIAEAVTTECSGYINYILKKFQTQK